MELTSRLDNAIGMAWQIHYGQKDKGGEPYILHVMRVVENVRKRGYGEEFMIVAALHDVIEDGGEQHRLGVEKFGRDVAEAVSLLTRDKKESYGKYIDRLKHNYIAKVVKLADLEDHMERANAKTFKKYDTYLKAKIKLEGIPVVGSMQVLSGNNQISG